MKLPIKLVGLALGLAGLVGATAVTAIAIDRRRHRLTGPGASAPRDLGVTRDIIEAEIVGISDVDPDLLMGMGEAVDPDRVKRAHEEIPEQRAKLRKA
jgi:hypothetical protein